MKKSFTNSKAEAAKIFAAAKNAGKSGSILGAEDIIIIPMVNPSPSIGDLIGAPGKGAAIPPGIDPNRMLLLDEIEHVSPDELKAFHDILEAGVFTASETAVGNPPGILGEWADLLSQEENRQQEIEQNARDATVLKSPMAVRKPLTFRSRFAVL